LHRYNPDPTAEGGDPLERELNKRELERKSMLARAEGGAAGADGADGTEGGAVGLCRLNQVDP
jgi:hypothetical protein